MNKKESDYTIITSEERDIIRGYLRDHLDFIMSSVRNKKINENKATTFFFDTQKLIGETGKSFREKVDIWNERQELFRKLYT